MEKILIATISQRHGINFYAARTLPGLTDQIANYVQEWWNRELPNIPMPEKELAQIKMYFEHVGYESLDFSNFIEVYD
ncbi:unnamed protein product [marine sediment metagenome]|uniref:Uncharacterized protein n=1 Tax=marine sediment metagenome TaxID=412755 RepID=X1CPG8_9ZZZZ